VSATRRWALDALLDDPATSTLVCAGSGGVGKTTTAAALAVRAAERGRRVVVLTVDPSRRLAQALGLAGGAASAAASVPQPVPGVRAAAGGSLHATVLDARATLDALVDAALEPARAAELKRNPVYASVAGSFSGTQEYMAMERLGQLRGTVGAAGGNQPQWDLVVVDTPPSRSALDFIDAPARLGRFLDGRLVTLLRRPPSSRGGLAGLPGAVASRLGGGVAAVMDWVLGARLLRDTQALVAGLDVVFGGFQRRAAATSQALAAPGSAFVVVTAAEEELLAESRYLLERLGRDGLPTAALVVNRATVVDGQLAWLDAAQAARTADALTGVGEGQVVRVTAELLRLHAELASTAADEAAGVAALLAGHPQVAVATVPARPGDVHDVAALRAVGADLAGM